MASISVTNKTKAEIDELKPEGDTYKEFVGKMLDAYRRDQGEIVNVEALVERIQERVATKVELAAYRGVTEALETKQ